jgi:hypothetical protein
MGVPSTEKRVTLEAKSRVNKATLTRRQPHQLVVDIKQKLAKELLAQLLLGDMIEVESSTNPTSGATTFVARITFVKDTNKNNNESPTTNQSTTENP